ncbi:MAG: UxaA family hydrolase [Candidatus Eremiobacteraeota bacterium]|nr:UxaA family hydrolase [Candidatus Eremiobacteraeota bacterium]
MALSSDGLALRLAETDNVAVALRRIATGSSIVFGDLAVVASEEIAPGHKIALRTIDAGEAVVKYGETMGRATVRIAAGSHAHVHNIEGIRGRGDLAAAGSR